MRFVRFMYQSDNHVLKTATASIVVIEMARVP